MKIFIRLDDISADMDWQRFYAVKDILDKHGICPLIGVVPKNLDPKLHKAEYDAYFFDYILSLKAKGWVIAQHGTNHIYTTSEAGLLGINNRSEFAGLSYEDQYSLLKEGQMILNDAGIYTDIFMAPAHSFDLNTLKALAALGFKTVTDGLHNTPYFRENLLFIPCRLRDFKSTPWDTICLHTNMMSEIDITNFDDYLTRMGKKIASFDVEEAKKYAIEYSRSVASSERHTLKMRNKRNLIANSKRLSWYMSYTNHANPIIKWLKRMLFAPMLLLLYLKKYN